MCMEDIKMGRKMVTQVKSFTGGVAEIQVASANPNRVRLVLSSDQADAVRWRPERFTGVSPSPGAFFTSLSSGPLVLRVEDIGDMIFDNWYAAEAVGTGNLGVTDVALYETKV